MDDREKYSAKEVIVARLKGAHAVESPRDVTVAAARSFYDTLMDAGVRIFEFEASVLHSKTAVVDSSWSTIGSSNLDPISMEFNNELNAIVLDRRFARQMMASFRDDLEHAQEIHPHGWSQRGIWSRLKEVGARLLKPFL